MGTFLERCTKTNKQTKTKKAKRSLITKISKKITRTKNTATLIEHKPVIWINSSKHQLRKGAAYPPCETLSGAFVSSWARQIKPFLCLKKKPIHSWLEKRTGLCSKIPLHPLLCPHSCPQFPKQSQVSGSIKTILPHANCYCQAPWFYFSSSLLLSNALMEIVLARLCSIR